MWLGLCFAVVWRTNVAFWYVTQYRMVNTIAKHLNAYAGPEGYALFTVPPLSCNGEKIDFVCLFAAMPGRRSGGQVHKVKKTAAPLV